MTASMMHATRVALGATSGSAATREVDFLSCTIGKQGSHIQSEGMRGTRSYISELVNDGTYNVGGQLVLHPRPVELDMILPFILGGSETADDFPLAETLPEFGVDVYKVAQVCRYAGMKVNQATFRCGPNQPLTLEMDVQGKTETTGISFPSLTNVSNVAPYVFSEMTLTLDSVAYPCFSVAVTINNNLMLDHHMNSQSRTELPEQSRVITLQTSVQMTSTEASALYAGSVAGIAGSLAFAKGNYALTLAFAKLQRPVEPVVIPQRNGEVVLNLSFVARKDATTPTMELVTTNDSTS